ncbi:UDP-N-acetylmuramoylalanyl-D-glutamate--2,6-diaminopimelate ligase [hydrothermal vent metagenome]|uniref:UDP-N-acetylmuramoylalanyl-D-glutamate--2,6-diaminopimelate ligase n=1 Tax=hydrothermal vent metagenome TaxID=652676 RepID=A0A3B0R5X4_9ZZZZ
MRLKELMRAIGEKATKDAEVLAIECDSRKVDAGSLFVAISGEHFDGANFIKDAAGRGAVCAVTERFIKDVSCEQIIVEDCKSAFATLSAALFSEPSACMKMAGVTGTNGKTTVAYILESIFKAAGKKSALMGTIQYRYGDTVLDSTLTTPMANELQGFLRDAADSGVTHSVMEVSSHALSQRRVDGCDFDVKVFTNLTPEHLDYHGTMEAYFEDKARFFVSGDFGAGRCGSVINIDDEWGRVLKERTMPALSYSLESGADIYPQCYGITRGGIKGKLRIPGSAIVINSELIGEHNLYNIMAAAGAAYVMGIANKSIEKGIKNLKSIPGRLEKVVAAGQAFDVYVDYAHTPDALERTLKVLNSLKKKGRLITVFGCGGDRDKTKRPVMGATAVELSDVAIVSSDNPRDEDPAEIISDVESGIKGFKRLDANMAVSGKGYYAIVDRTQAVRKAVDIARAGDIVFVAGKGHEDYQIVKGERLYFDDRVVLKEALKARGSLKTG